MALELECAVRYACGRYAGILHSEGNLREGLRRLGTLKRFLAELVAKNPHYLLGCLEVRNVLSLSELEMQAVLARKETRGNFISLDYPDKDPAMDGKIICQKLVDGKSRLEIKDQIGLKDEYRGGGK